MYKKTIMFALTLLALLGTAPALTACNTVEGAGHDISNTGDAIQRSAD